MNFNLGVVVLTEMCCGAVHGDCRIDKLQIVGRVKPKVF